MQVVLKRAHDYSEIKGPVEKKIEEYARRGYRALGIGYADGGCRAGLHDGRRGGLGTVDPQACLYTECMCVLLLIGSHAPGAARMCLCHL